MKVGELIRLARKHGCYIKRHGSEHDIWVSPITGGSASIPRHQSKELGTGIAERIKKILGLP
ncbi:MAG: type II toxin-antitoxin system HicA family toxin [Clostridiales bacterium]|nr:type II toxin-antitoxin system HicA family toxin [Clostridiales bacterium]